MENRSGANVDMGSGIRCHDTLLNLAMPDDYELKRLKLMDTPLYDQVVNARSNLYIKYLASNLSNEAAPKFIFDLQHK